MKQQEVKLGRDIAVTIAIALVCTVLGFGASLSMDEPLPALALIYGVAMISLAWRYPHMALGVCMATAPFQNDISAGLGPFRMSLGEVSLAFCFIVYCLRWFMKTVTANRGPYFAVTVIYFAICVSSSMISWTDMALTSLLQMSLYFFVAPLVFANFVKRIETLQVTIYMLVAVCVFLSIWGLASGTFFIFGLHKNGVGSSLGVGVIAATELFLVQKKRVRQGIMLAIIVIITAGLIFSVSRGAWIGALAGYLVVVGTRGKVKFIMQSMALLVPLIVVFWNLLPDDKKDYAASFDSKRENISARYESIDLARSKFSESPIFGVGVGLRKEMDATNIFWVTLAETGVQGLIAFGALHLMCLVMIFRTQKFVSRKDPRFSILVLGGAMIFSKVVHGVVDHYWSRGALLIAWACCGMATAVYFEEQNRLKRLNIDIMKIKRKRLRNIRPELMSDAT